MGMEDTGGAPLQVDDRPLGALSGGMVVDQQGRPFSRFHRLDQIGGKGYVGQKGLLGAVIGQ
jgi:hypothetical protein